ncbi:DNA polymerase subunit delta-2 [Grosmannia clavigera kw1407]|uniref:DNA polymerase subunit delta-2 n=1 Tax=Grosmannia clavigera (strain kw1407 / UAMH 11150) TaxID=655863 RepID=F0XEB8_GROCL|nr:DNA polymerase subunit delta-2 [Grosmannia clavigera kw1407]EFX03931.1 DNA polymerase subunit delta-2 [Grosmannia clavigera kw1407]
MKVNETTAISTSRVLLVPYDSHHVPTYHDWMEDEAVRVATASDRLTLAEEYENQVEWRAAADKLTFVLCRPLGERDESSSGGVVAGVDDVPSRMVGDINFFLHVWDDEDDNDEDHGGTVVLYSGEVDVMIARAEDRGQGFGRAAVTALLYFVLQRHREAILAEAAAGAGAGTGARAGKLRRLVVKIQATNTASIGLFTGLGFQQRGSVNYFGEVELVQDIVDGGQVPEGYAELEYIRRERVKD